MSKNNLNAMSFQLQYQKSLLFQLITSIFYLSLNKSNMKSSVCTKPKIFLFYVVEE